MAKPHPLQNKPISVLFFEFVVQVGLFAMFLATELDNQAVFVKISCQNQLPHEISFSNSGKLSNRLTSTLY